MGFEEFIVSHANVFFYIAIIEAFLIIGLVVYILFGKWDDENHIKKVPETDSAYFAGRNTSSYYYWKEAYEKLEKEFKKYKKDVERENKSLKNEHESFSNPLPYNKAAASSNSNDHIFPSYNSLEEYAAREMSKGIYVNQTTNDDGTDKIEVVFAQTDEDPLPVSNPPKYEYLEAANGGQFRKLLPSEEKCFFRTWEENGLRKFEFHGNVENALANINAIFDDVCEIEGKQNGATQIINVDPGILDSKLKVETPAKIKLS